MSISAAAIAGISDWFWMASGGEYTCRAPSPTPLLGGPQPAGGHTPLGLAGCGGSVGIKGLGPEHVVLCIRGCVRYQDLKLRLGFKIYNDVGQIVCQTAAQDHG